MLTTLTKGKAADKKRNVPDKGNGMMVWWTLHKKWEPETEGRHQAMLVSILNKPFSEKSFDQILEWERELGEYEQPPALALDHPKTPSKSWARDRHDLLLPYAKRLEQMPPVEDAATERVFEIRRGDAEDAGSVASADDEDYYGTLM